MPPYEAAAPKQGRRRAASISRLPGARSPREAIRRHYQRTIEAGLRTQKQPAPVWASPEELEKAAACQAPALHQIYEKARYSDAACTREDLDPAREQ